MLNQKLQLKLSQKLSPQQIQLMKLIQLSTQEFEQRLSREIEEVVELILEASSREAAADQLKSDYGLSETQALGILDMPLEQLTVDGLEALELEYRSYVN